MDPKRYLDKVVQVLLYHKLHLLFIFRVKGDLPVPFGEVDGGQVLRGPYHLQESVHPRHWIRIKIEQC